MAGFIIIVAWCLFWRWFFNFAWTAFGETAIYAQFELEDWFNGQG